MSHNFFFQLVHCVAHFFSWYIVSHNFFSAGTFCHKPFFQLVYCVTHFFSVGTLCHTFFQLLHCVTNFFQLVHCVTNFFSAGTLCHTTFFSWYIVSHNFFFSWYIMSHNFFSVDTLCVNYSITEVWEYSWIKPHLIYRIRTMWSPTSSRCVTKWRENRGTLLLKTHGLNINSSCWNKTSEGGVKPLASYWNALMICGTQVGKVLDWAMSGREGSQKKETLCHHIIWSYVIISSCSTPAVAHIFM